MGVTDPAGNDTIRVPTGLSGSCSFYDTEVDYYKRSSKATSPVLLRKVLTAYSSTQNPFDQYGDGTVTRANVVPTSVTTEWPIPNSSNYLVSQVQTDYDNSFTFYPGPLSGSTYVRVTEERVYPQTPLELMSSVESCRRATLGRMCMDISAHCRTCISSKA